MCSTISFAILVLPFASSSISALFSPLSLSPFPLFTPPFASSSFSSSVLGLHRRGGNDHLVCRMRHCSAHRHHRCPSMIVDAAAVVVVVVVIFVVAAPFPAAAAVVMLLLAAPFIHSRQQQQQQHLSFLVFSFIRRPTLPSAHRLAVVTLALIGIHDHLGSELLFYNTLR